MNAYNIDSYITRFDLVEIVIDWVEMYNLQYCNADNTYYLYTGNRIYRDIPRDVALTIDRARAEYFNGFGNIPRPYRVNYYKHSYINGIDSYNKMSIERTIKNKKLLIV